MKSSNLQPVWRQDKAYVKIGDIKKWKHTKKSKDTKKLKDIKKLRDIQKFLISLKNYKKLR